MALSAFFSGMEIAFVSSNRMLAEMDKERNGFSQKLISVFYRHPNGFVSTMLVGNNIVLVVYGILIAQFFDSTIFRGMDVGLTVPADTILSTLIILFTGEFLPKTLFKNNANRLLAIFAPLAYVFYVVLWPISRFSTLISKCMLRLVGIKMDKESDDEGFSKVDLDYLVQSSIDNAENDEIDDEVKMFQNALDFSETKVRDCMVPRTEINAVDINDCTTQRNPDDWKEQLCTMPFVPETMLAQKLMHIFLQQKKSLGVVVDEFGGTSGLVSLEDIVEEILGDIEDEHDSTTYIATKVGEDEYMLSARLEIDKVNDMFGLDLPESDEYMTVGGLILHEYQSFPKLNEVVKIGRFEFRIIKNTMTKIEVVKLKVNA